MLGHPRFSSSQDYWEGRYRRGGTSGAGSYRRLAVFKADFLNEFVAENGIETVIEFGSGDGAQLELAKYPNYVGVDVSRTIVEETRRKFSGDSSLRFIHTSEVTSDDKADLALSLDVVYHLVEDYVFTTYMDQLFGSARHFVIVYSSNKDEIADSAHVRHREFTAWVAANRADFELSETIRNIYPYCESDPENTSFSDFYVFKRIV